MQSAAPRARRCAGAPQLTRRQPRSSARDRSEPRLADPGALMLRLRKIDSFDLPELQPYRTMRRQEEHKQAGIFVAEGEKVVRRLLESPLTVVSVLLPERWLAELERLLERRPETVEVFVADKSLLETRTGF